MEWIPLLAAITLVYFAVCFILIVIGDCDIVLQLAAKFGKKPGVMMNKVVWITGASSGIGESLAYELAKHGCRLVLSARREEELERVRKECLMRGKTKEEDILILPLDMVEFESHKAAFETTCKGFSKVDILVNNAGRFQIAEWEKTDLTVDRDILDLNVLGALSLSKLVLPSMLERRNCHIVNISSVAGIAGVPLSGSYSGSKHAIMGWFDSLRIEVASRGVYVTNICPGFVSTNFLSEAFTETAGEKMDGRIQPEIRPILMSTARCAELCVIAIANRLDEVWIARNPTLFLLYLNQYFPNFYKFIGKKILGPPTMKIGRKLRN